MAHPVGVSIEDNQAGGSAGGTAVVMDAFGGEADLPALGGDVDEWALGAQSAGHAVQDALADTLAAALLVLAPDVALQHLDQLCAPLRTRGGSSPELLSTLSTPPPSHTKTHTHT